MALDCKKLVEITEKSRGMYLAKASEWMNRRRDEIGKQIVSRAEGGYGNATISLSVAQVLGINPTPDTISLAGTVCRQAMKEFIGEDEQVEISSKVNYENILVTVSWKAS